MIAGQPPLLVHECGLIRPSTGSIAFPDRQCLAGQWRRPHNDLQQQRVGGGHKAIHDDATAAEAGFSGAPIHGTVHYSQFTPLLLDVFGPAWFESGSISVHFRTIVSHLQPVRAFIEAPPAGAALPLAGAQLSVWMEHADGRVVLEGTASAGLTPAQLEQRPTGTTTARAKIAQAHQRRRNAELAGAGPLLFMNHRLPLGTRTIGVERAAVSFDRKEIGPLFPFSLQQKLACITEFHPWFSQEAGAGSPWGAPVLAPECLNAVMLGMCGPGAAEPPHWPGNAPHDAWLDEAFGGATPVGLFGGCEVFIHAGPVLADKEYEVVRELVATGETPKTEFSWVKTELREPDGGRGGGRLVAEMLLQEMKLKDSFPGYAGLRARSDAAHTERRAAKL
eukprot:g790.t1